MRSVPRFREGVVAVRWERDPTGAVWYVVQRPGGPAVRLNAGMMVLAVLADGRRHLGAVYEAVRAAGLDLDDPAVVVLTFRRLELAGACQMEWHLESTGPVRHTCTACGQSCEGQLIGPLSDREIERLLELKEALRDLEPDLPEADPVVLFHGRRGPEPALNTSLGRCVFLTGDRLCAIHKHFGGSQKPLKCQLFPLRVVETEDGFRVGISSRCTMAHRSFRSGPERSAAQAVDELGLRRPPGDLVGLDPAAPRSLRPTPAFEANRAAESYFLSLLGEPGMTLTAVIASLDGQRRSASGLPPAYLATVAGHLRTFATTYAHDPLDQPHSHFGAGVRAFLADLRGLPEQPGWEEPPEPARAYLLHALRQLVYLRETTAYGGVTLAVQVALMGAMGALWTTHPWTAGDLPSDALGQRLAYWLRIHNGGRAVPHLFSDESALTAQLGLLAGVA